MKWSTERILTTHAGRLPNPDNIAETQKARADGDQATFDQLVKTGVADRVRKQMELRNDIHSDGEFWKARDAPYYHSRVIGVEMQPLQPGEWPSILGHQQERHMPEFRGFYAIELFRNKRQGKLSSKKAMEEASSWVYSSEMTVR